MKRLIAIALALCITCTALGGPADQMVYGPHQMMTFKARYPGNNTAYKAAVIKVGENAYVAFDTELLRYCAGWTGGFIDFKGVSYNGDHGQNPGLVGEQLFATSAAPGWADAGGKFDDTRENKPYGHLPKEWAHYKGLYHYGDQVILSYTVGNAKVLEMPGYVKQGPLDVFYRSIRIEGADKATELVICDVDGAITLSGGQAFATTRIKSRIKQKDPATNKEKEVEVTRESRLFIGLKDAPSGASWSLANDNKTLRLKLPKLDKAENFSILIGTGGENDGAEFTKLLNGDNKARERADLVQFTRGGPRKWTEEVKTRGLLNGIDPTKKNQPVSDPKAAYVVDTITIPFNNPYKSWMRTGGFDFFKDGTSAAVSTWNGDVWIVKGIDDKLETLTWTRFATGLHDGLGLKIVDDVVYVHGRDGITRLHDLNRDGQADFYENFNNDIIITHGFHEFQYELQTDKEGNFYFVKGGAVNPGGSGWQVIQPHHGCAFRLSKDGSKLDVIATGLRAPNGMAIGPRGELTTGDNEGTWVPKCRINYWTAEELSKRKGFGGVVDLAHSATKPTIYDPPICWMPKNVCNSGGGQAWVTSKKWGEFEGDLLYASYGTCTLFKVLKEDVDGVPQGGVVKIPVKFDSGTCRLRFNDSDGQLYVVGIKGWQSTAAKDGCFQRVRYTGKPANLPTGLKATTNGLAITFTCKLDKTSGEDAGSYQVQQWNYKWTSGYGSEHYKVSNPKERGADPVTVKSAKLSADGKTVFLTIDGIAPVMQMYVKYALETDGGDEVKGEIYNTINKLGDKPLAAG
jgi:hypothetical protein